MARAGWHEALEQRISSLDYESQLQDAGRPWVEADEDGNLTTRGAAPPAA